MEEAFHGGVVVDSVVTRLEIWEHRGAEDKGGPLERDGSRVPPPRLSDETGALLEPHLPGREGSWGGVAHDNRQLINAVFWSLRTGAPWRDLPPAHGGWSNAHRRFIRWRDKGI